MNASVLAHTTDAVRRHLVDDELLRVPMVVDQVLDATWNLMLARLNAALPNDRETIADIVRGGKARRARIADRFVTAVREQVHADFASAGRAVAASPKASELSLIDEEQIDADIEVSRTIEEIERTCEQELRELFPYLAALVGDADPGDEHNPFRAETYARALWQAAQEFEPRDAQRLLMRLTSPPLAQVLRVEYAGLRDRLRASGLVPVDYRTLIHRGPAVHDEVPAGRAPDLHVVRAAVSVPPVSNPPPSTGAVALERLLNDAAKHLRALPADAPPATHAVTMRAHHETLLRHAPNADDRQSMEMVWRLFDAMLADPRLSWETRKALARLQPAALRMLLGDSTMLSNYAHPVWAFMDKLTHQAGLHPQGSPARTAVLRIGEDVADAAARAGKPDLAPFRQGLAQLEVDAQARLQARLARVSATVGALEGIDQLPGIAGRPLPEGAAPLDAGQLDTVPGDLIAGAQPARPDAPDAAAWLAAQRPGDWIRLFCRGRWLQAQLLWRGRHGETWLYGSAQDVETIALRRDALERLHFEGLARTWHQRSVLRSAALQLLRRRTPGTLPGEAAR